jgi:uncharacterized iron-regulated membrane protein
LLGNGGARYDGVPLFSLSTAAQEDPLKLQRLNRVIHRWGSLLIALPVLLVITTGVILQAKKVVPWVQPPTQKGSSAELALTFDRILEIVETVSEAEIESWDDIDRLDVRPGKGMLKVRSKNRWEVQLDLKTGEILQTAYRRSDFIESLHDGSFFHDRAKLWIFLPNGIVLLFMWLTGIYLFILPYQVKWRRRRREAAKTG